MGGVSRLAICQEVNDSAETAGITVVVADKTTHSPGHRVDSGRGLVCMCNQVLGRLPRGRDAVYMQPF